MEGDDVRTIYKYRLNAVPVVELELPKGAHIVHVHEQNGEPVMWVLQDVNAGSELRRFRVFGTGHEIPDGHEYVGSCHVRPFVWHVFEVKT